MPSPLVAAASIICSCFIKLNFLLSSNARCPQLSTINAFLNSLQQMSHTLKETISMMPRKCFLNILIQLQDFFSCYKIIFLAVKKPFVARKKILGQKKKRKKIFCHVTKKKIFAPEAWEITHSARQIYCSHSAPSRCYSYQKKKSCPNLIQCRVAGQESVQMSREFNAPLQV